MAGPTLILNTTQFGHADLLDELEAGANEVFCNCRDKHEDGGETKAKYPYLDFFGFSFYLIFQIIRFCKADKDSDKYSYRYHLIESVNNNLT